MALINCPECGKEVSDKADNCIHCGLPLTIEIKLEAGVPINLDDIIELASEYESMSTPDYKYAFELYSLAANHGSAEAQYHVGRMYKWGDGVEKSLSNARHWFETAYANGYEDAREDLMLIDNPIKDNSPYIIPVKSAQITNEQYVAKCPTCNSPNISKISIMNKAGSAIVLGVFSLGHISKTFKCNNCGHSW